MDNQTPGAAARSSIADNSEAVKSLVERLSHQNVSPLLRSLLLDPSTPNLHGLCHVEVLERLQGLSKEVSDAMQKQYKQLETMALQNRGEIQSLQERLTLSERKTDQLNREITFLNAKFTDLETRKSKETPSRSGTAERTNIYSAMSVDKPSQNPQLQQKTSVEAQQTVAPATVQYETRQRSTLSSSSSSDSDKQPDHDFDPARIPPRDRRSRRSEQRRGATSRPTTHPVVPKQEPLPYSQGVQTPRYPQQGPPGYAQPPYPPMGHPSQFEQPMPYPDINRPMSESYLHQPTQVRLGPGVAYLQPLTTMLEPFRFVVDYRAYRLVDQRQECYESELIRMHKLTKKVSALFPKLPKFDGTKPMKLLSLLHTLVKAFNSLGICEGVAVRGLSYYLTGEASRFFDSQTSPGYLYSGTPREFAWPNVVDALLKRYLSDHVLHDAYQQVTSITQAENEDESAYAARLSEAAQNCNHVFNERTLVHHYITGLLPTTRDIVTERVRGLPIHEQSDLSAVRRVAVAEGATYRARQRSYQQPKSKTSRNATMYMGEPSMMSFQPAYRPELEKDEGYESAAQSLNVVTSLDPFLFVPEQAQNTSSSSTESEIDNLIKAPKESVPTLTEEQRRMAYKVIPDNTWHYECWGCRGKQHSLFQCPHLTPDQRIFYAYKYYLHKLQKQPQLSSYYENRLRKRREDQKPSKPTYRPQSGQTPSILRKPNTFSRDRKPVLTIQEPTATKQEASESENSEGQ